MTILLPPLKETLERHGLRADKRLGQHFLLDGNITDKIVRLAGDLGGVHVIEIGPGPGGLTRAILGLDSSPRLRGEVRRGNVSANSVPDDTTPPPTRLTSANAEEVSLPSPASILRSFGASEDRSGRGIASLTVIEMDARALPILEELAAASAVPLRIVHGDALKVDLTTEVPAPRAILANLPYNAGTEMLIRWLHNIAADAGAYKSLTLMFQKEVAQRLTASPGSNAYGRLSVLAQWLCEVTPLFTLPPGAFTPPPKVESSVVRLVPRLQLEAGEIKALERVTAAAFGQRRKMLRASLKSLGVDTEALLAATGIDGTLRAENLSVQEFLKLSRVCSEMAK